MNFSTNCTGSSISAFFAKVNKDVSFKFAFSQNLGNLVGAELIGLKEQVLDNEEVKYSVVLSA